MYVVYNKINVSFAIKICFYVNLYLAVLWPNICHITEILLYLFVFYTDSSISQSIVITIQYIVYKEIVAYKTYFNVINVI